MGIQFETDYNMETLTAMAKGLRKTVRKKRSRRVHIFAAVVLILGLLTILATTAGGDSGEGGCAPRPRKLSPAATRMAVPMRSEVVTITPGSVPGRMCRSTSGRRFTPMERAAWT